MLPKKQVFCLLESFRSYDLQKCNIKFQAYLNQCRHYSSTTIDPTPVRYPYVKRGNYSTLNDNHVRFFENVLGKSRVLTNEDDVEMYNVDWLKMVRGSSRLVLKPKSTEEVSEILKFCNTEKLAVCPQGGNTGLVGGSVPVFDEIVISMALMNNIVNLDELSGVLVCEAGCILETLETYLSERGLIMPLDLGAKGSCQIGGNVSTNAGGIRLLRYGSLHGSVLGVEAVKANGEVIDCLSTLKKDNTGYHLKHLFIGSEGTLGLVTKVAIQCPTASKSINTAFLGLNSFDDVLKTYKEARNSLGEILSSCEMMDASSVDSCTSNLKLQNPIGEFPFYMVIETSGSNGTHDEEKLNYFLEKCMSENIVQDGTVATEPSKIKSIWMIRELVADALVADGFLYTYDLSIPHRQFYDTVSALSDHARGCKEVVRCCGFGHLGKNMWEVREGITASLLHDGYVYKYDISLPYLNFYSIIPEMRKRLGNSVIRVCGYGHIGDGNLHLNITSKEFRQDILDMIEPFVFEYTSKLKGSVSAEHGIGFKKTKFIHYSKSSSSISLMKDIKKLMDPNGILNPYKVLPW